MGKVILKAENISKQYRLGLVGTDSLVHDLNRFWHRVRGKEDPYLKIGSVNDRSAKATEDYVWALRDINFEVKEGEVLGIIGKNGAGKSTLLKLLSRVTSPSTGTIRSRGRIASLLEVGTGFHPELTGRENIYLNGAILGMTRAEIASKIDEIVDFSGCEMYIDTPTKRYSSGMTVRLAFAVAAHLEPDILVVDEVLAVGDAEFQKKAIGKMQDISSGQGRTVLFVSHNMGSVNRLCSRAMILQNGVMTSIGDTEEMVNQYLKNEHSKSSSTGIYKGNKEEGNPFYLREVRMFNSRNEITGIFLTDEHVKVEIDYELFESCHDLRINIKLLTMDDLVVFTSSSHDFDSTDRSKGLYRARLDLPVNFFNKGKYKLAVNVGIPNVKVLLSLTTILNFEMEKLTSSGSRMNQYFPGITAPNVDWKAEKL